jgi:hypothetical protein
VFLSGTVDAEEKEENVAAVEAEEEVGAWHEIPASGVFDFLQHVPFLRRNKNDF